MTCSLLLCTLTFLIEKLLTIVLLPTLRGDNQLTDWFFYFMFNSFFCICNIWTKQMNMVRASVAAYVCVRYSPVACHMVHMFSRCMCASLCTYIVMPNDRYGTSLHTCSQNVCVHAGQPPSNASAETLHCILVQ